MIGLKGLFLVNEITNWIQTIIFPNFITSSYESLSVVQLDFNYSEISARKGIISRDSKRIKLLNSENI